MASTASKDATNEPTTEIELRDGSTALVRENFAARFPAIAPDAETLELLQENLGDEELTLGDLTRVKVPSGELNSWVITRAGEDTSAKELLGVMVAIKPRRAYWENQDPDGSRPDCSSTDGRTPDAGGRYHPSGELGHMNPTGLCRNCPMGQWQSDPKNGRGKACGEQRLVFLVVDGGLFPLVVTVPPTSLKGVKKYATDLLELRLPYYGVETALGLNKETSKDGQKYNKITFRLAGRLTPEETAAAKLYGQQMKDLIDAAVQDFSTAAADLTDEGSSVGDGTSS